MQHDLLERGHGTQVGDSEGLSSRSALWLALQSLTHKAGIQRDDLLGALAGELSELRWAWQANLYRPPGLEHAKALELARTALRTNLVLQINKFGPPDGVDRRRYIHTLLICFNLSTGQAHAQVMNKNLTARRNWLANEAPVHLRVSASTSQRYLEHAISQIEQQILDAGYEPAPAPTAVDLPPTVLAIDAANDVIIGIPVPPDDDTLFIPRPRLAADFDKVLSDADDLLCVIGEPGTGKTRFVREHTAARNPLWIDATSDVTLLDGMVQLLHDYGMETTSFDSVRIKQAFRDLLTQKGAPELVVIDGIADPEALDPVIPMSATSQVIVTSCVHPPKGWWVVHVPDMDGNEAAALAESLLPGFKEQDYHTLAAVFGYRPLLVTEACSLAEHRGMADLQLFCSGMRDRIALTRVKADWIDPNVPTLEAIYGEYVRLLSSEAPDSVELLRFLCFMAHRHIPAEFAMSYLMRVPYITPDLLQEGRAQDIYEKAIERLVRYSLVTEMASGCCMQPLAQRILRGIFYRVPYGARQGIQIAAAR
jgi:hypothetical protein